MKRKDYITPDIQVISIALTQLLADSLTGTLSTSEENRITTSDAFGSRDGDGDWDDE